MSGWRSSGAAALVGVCLAGLVVVAASVGAGSGDTASHGDGLALATGVPSGPAKGFPGAGGGPRRGAGVGPAATDGSDDDTEQSSRPNVVVVLTDDQTDYDLRWMPLTRAALGEDGMEFTDAISPHPLCCPARAEMITGQYAQNNGVQHNNGPHGGYEALDPTQTIGQWFQDAGYQTGFVGKYLNGYHAQAGRNPGWTLWDPLVQGIYDYFDFAFFNDGQGVATYDNYYVTNAVEERTNAAVRTFARDDRPFLLYSFHLAPHYRFDGHGNTEPPPVESSDRDAYADAVPPSLGKPSFNVATQGSLPDFLRGRTRRTVQEVRETFLARIRSLRAVDRSVESLVATLKETGEWDNTWLFFTSDNGYSMGEHRLVGKNVLTEESMQVPLLVHGPGVVPGSTSSLPVTLVDLPATFADLAGVTPLRAVDGSSLAPALAGQASPFRDTTLVQTGTSYGDGWAYRGVRTSRFTYAVRGAGDDVILYDRARDPYELVNRADDPAYAAIRTQLETRRQQLVACASWTCNPAFGQLPEPAAPAKP
ncbi:sulfatase family protein [Nocardioides sp. LHG3406-4]|uniref:sulfatase family protein n=1 Tax=Nocardioides sp. LHG3406-4 TaxID=2804575 RepID=UPI003CEAB806